ncbi:hypothetical protein NX059_008193 [Plenodomus lindquistii]|nr:hypothetical protein NX059_008193 [Plenodomus lindquistii]
MRPLKRGRREPLELERAHKRSRGDLHQQSSAIDVAQVFWKPSSTDTRPETEVQADASTCCAHREAALCCLTQVKCCACADLRSQSIGYSLYIDGIGVRNQGQRWRHYCPGCRVYWEIQAKQHLKHRPYAIQVTCGGQSFDIVRSDCSTLRDLKTEVARRMRCEPYQLKFVASDVDWDLQIQPFQMHHDTDLIAHARHIHLRSVANEPSIAEDDAMEGITFGGRNPSKVGLGFTLSD